MKCPRCGYENPPEGTQDGKCNECGYLLFPVNSQRHHQADLASLDQRFLAQLIDSFIYLGILILSLSILPQSMFGVGFILALSYLLFSDALDGGQSLGKKVLQISVLDMTSRKPCTPMQSLIRNLSLAFLGIIDWVFIFSEKRQRLGDIMANTIVIKNN